MCFVGGWNISSSRVWLKLLHGCAGHPLAYLQAADRHMMLAPGHLARWTKNITMNVVVHGKHDCHGDDVTSTRPANLAVASHHRQDSRLKGPSQH